MQEQSDVQLLRVYAETGNETAFRQIVTRHADLIYSAALRQVGSSDLARDVAQSVFTDLARKAGPVVTKLTENSSLVGWLYRSTRFAALNLLRDDRRRLQQERQAMEQLIANSESNPQWEHVQPLLDEAMADLNDDDREAVLLRYFKNLNFRTVGSALGVSDDAAQKRVSRAVEGLREFFAKRGVIVGASGLAALVSANAVQAAPSGLTIAISTAALAGTTIAATTVTTTTATATATATKAIAMTTLQKTLIATTVAVLAGAGIHEARQASQLREQVQTLQQQQAPLAEQIQQLRQERDNASNTVAALNEQVELLNRNSAELLRLRAENARFRTASGQSAAGGNSGQKAATASVATETSSPAQLIQQGWQLLQSGRMAEAIPAFENAAKLDPTNSDAWNGLGWATFNSGKKADAEKAFQQAVELQPDHPAALNGLGQMYLAERKYAEAEQYLLKAGPKAPAAWYGLTRLYLLQDKFDDAERWAQTIVDSGQADESVRAMLKAAKDKKVSDALRLMIEPQ